ncbi:MAG TPA: alkaline phosphatase family protein [Pyrinomonadaceae bacterium]|jgi:phospholipase C|nr:alkaline phosphatase family protein [Pyrinomonadaceae bacterium]
MTTPPKNPLDNIEHVVVLMLENRSFDNILGYLYDPGNPPPFNTKPPANFEGVSGKNLSNPGPGGKTYPVAPGNVLTNPNPDPGEPYEDIYSQLYNVPAPALGNVPPNPPQPPAMQGFVNNYAAQPNVTDPSIIMNCFTPASLPVTSSLAYYYGVCDHWFASIPTQTLCNRSYVHAGTSSGYVDNEGDNGILFINYTPTIFNVLESQGVPWKVYHGSWLIACLSLLTQDQMWHFKDLGRFAHMSQFKKDAKKKGGLPAYSFIEPIYIDSLVWGPENDMHPEAWDIHFDGLSNVEQGERLLYEVYTTLRASPDWEKILFVITFDEHGGCYDHVAPPAKGVKSPDGIVIPPSQKGGSGFGFNRLGVRVPAIIVSAYTPPQTIVNQNFDHTSVLSTVVNRFGLPQNRLGARAAGAPDLGAALTLTQPRTDKPPIPKPSSSMLSTLKLGVERLTPKPLTELQRTILEGAAYRLGKSGIAPLAASELSKVSNTLEADAALAKHEVALLRNK